MSYKQLYAVPVSKFEEFVNGKDVKFPNVQSLSVDQLNINKADKINSNYAIKNSENKDQDLEKDKEKESNEPERERTNVDVNVNAAIPNPQKTEGERNQEYVWEKPRLNPNANYHQYFDGDRWAQNPEMVKPELNSDLFYQRNQERAKINNGESDLVQQDQDAMATSTPVRQDQSHPEFEASNERRPMPYVSPAKVMGEAIGETAHNLANLRNVQSSFSTKNKTPQAASKNLQVIKQEYATVSPSAGKHIKNTASKLFSAAAPKPTVAKRAGVATRGATRAGLEPAKKTTQNSQQAKATRGSIRGSKASNLTRK